MEQKQLEYIVDRELGGTMRHHAEAAIEAFGSDGVRRPGWHTVAAAHLRHALACCEAVEATLLTPLPTE